MVGVLSKVVGGWVLFGFCGSKCLNILNSFKFGCFHCLKCDVLVVFEDFCVSNVACLLATDFESK